MNAFDPLLWTAIAYLVVRVARSSDERLWLAVGALAGITILNKYAIIFWLSGLVIGLCLTPLRESLRHRWFFHNVFGTVYELFHGEANVQR
jgi:4-amino-4-deoxy-L-arabinose transferase-like glycosyltransferase